MEEIQKDSQKEALQATVVETMDTEQIVQEQAPLVPYIPKSKGTFQIQTLIPRNMAFEVQTALNHLVMEKGNIDHFVRDQLRYVSNEKMWKALAAEQVDAIGLYLKQFERNQGIIIADQTGVGKGRQAAAVIRHAVKNGCLPIFFTKSPNLFTDIYRDLVAIDFGDVHPFIVNTDSAQVRDERGMTVFSPLSASAQMDLLTTTRKIPMDSNEALQFHKQKGIPLPDIEKEPELTLYESIDYLPPEYDMIFCTYSQVQAAHYFKREWLENLCKAGIAGSKKYKEVVFILDESHLAGGYESIIGRWFRKVLPTSKACCFLSATFAKYPEVMPFYAKKTAILEANLSSESLVGSMKSGGLALQEIVASNLSESAQLIRRQRSSEGIKVEYITLNEEPLRSKHRQMVDQIVTLMRRVIAFQENYITPILDAMHLEAKRVGEKMHSPPKGLGVSQAPYFSRVFNIVDQLLFALKVDGVASHTIEALLADKKVVIAFKSTMGSFLKDLNLSNGDIIDPSELDFTRILLKGLESIFKYMYVDIEGKKVKKTLSKTELSVRGMLEYEAIREEMLKAVSGLDISPIDRLIEAIETAKKPKGLGGHQGDHFTVAEVTGRNQRIYFDDDEAVVGSFRKDTEAAYRKFNEGVIDVLMINQSGSTGASAHASKDFKDQRQRVMIIHQFDLDVNIVMQILGRVNRTGQVNLPIYKIISTDIPMETRLLTMLKGKLKSLDANTTGSQKTNDDTLESADFMNKYGDIAAYNWIKENKNLMPEMGYPCHSKKKTKQGTLYFMNASEQGAIRQLTGRAGLLFVKDQERLYNELLQRYKHQLIIEKQRGTYDLETEFLPLNAEIKKRFLFRQGHGGDTPFGKDVVREETIIENLNRPYTKNEIDALLVKTLEGKTAQNIKETLLLQLDKHYPKQMEKMLEKEEQKVARIEAEIDSLPEELPAAEREETLERLEQTLAMFKTEVTKYAQTLSYVQTKMRRFIGYFTIGELVKIPLLGGLEDEPSYGIFLGASIGEGLRNTYVESNVFFLFAVADQRKTLTYTLQNPEDNFISLIHSQSQSITEDERLTVPSKWNQLIENLSLKREKRHILTENILAVSDYVGRKHKLIKYNTQSGIIKNGILLERESGVSNEFKPLVPISEIRATFEVLAIGDIIEDKGLGIRFKRIKENHFQVYIHKKEHYKLPLDARLRSLILKAVGQQTEELADFVQEDRFMTGVVPLRNLTEFLKVLDKFNIQVEGSPKELENWEIENKEDWEERSKKSTQTFWYELGKPFGQNSHPQSGFLGYEEPSVQYPFGKVSFDRKLTDKEKYNGGLIPIFKNKEVPYLEWKKSLKGTVLEKEFINLATSVKELPIYEATRALGYFIVNHPHESGNIEYVFARYTPEELGTTAYEDMIRSITKMRRIIDTLKLYNELKAA